jgi:hypothetical protein
MSTRPSIASARDVQQPKYGTLSCAVFREFSHHLNTIDAMAWTNWTRCRFCTHFKGSIGGSVA